MDGLWNPAADSALRNEVLGFTTYTLLAVLGLLVMIFIMRLLTMRFAPAVLGTIIRSEAIKGKTASHWKRAAKAAGKAGKGRAPEALRDRARTDGAEERRQQESKVS